MSDEAKEIIKSLQCGILPPLKTQSTEYDLISREAIFKALLVDRYGNVRPDHEISGLNKTIPVRIIKDVISELPTVKAREMKYGKWIYNGDSMYCSVCKDFPVIPVETPYCPLCGAKMIGKCEDNRWFMKTVPQSYEP